MAISVIVFFVRCKISETYLTTGYDEEKKICYLKVHDSYLWKSCVRGGETRGGGEAGWRGGVNGKQTSSVNIHQNRPDQ